MLVPLSGMLSHPDPSLCSQTGCGCQKICPEAEGSSLGLYRVMNPTSCQAPSPHTGCLCHNISPSHEIQEGRNHPCLLHLCT